MYRYVSKTEIDNRKTLDAYGPMLSGNTHQAMTTSFYIDPDLSWVLIEHIQIS